MVVIMEWWYVEEVVVVVEVKLTEKHDSKRETDSQTHERTKANTPN